MLRHGTTTVEAKSGYGLSLEAELLSLSALASFRDRHPLEIVPTFLGAHDIPDEYRSNRAGYVSLVINEMIPRVAAGGLARFCDVFCEEGVFSPDETRRILEAARASGMKSKLHADEFKSSGAAELAVRLGAVSADHLMAVSDHGVAALASSSTVATLLPGTSYTLGAKVFAPARKLIDAGAVVALATDCNPGSNYCESMAMTISLACVHLRLTPAEALSAATVNGAAAVDLSGARGQIDVGRIADVIVWDAADYREIPYHYGVNLVRQVIKAGKVAADNTQTRPI